VTGETNDAEPSPTLLLPRTRRAVPATTRLYGKVKRGAATSIINGSLKPTAEQMERAVAALVPYVQEWRLPLNPQHVAALAGAVLTHFDSDASFRP
jgi:hypothetical protein